MDFQIVHNHWFLLCLGYAFLPRITMLCSVIWGHLVLGPLAWVGWFFCPHLTVAFLSLAYWESNPWLVVFAWLCALGGEGCEKSACSKGNKN